MTSSELKRQICSLFQVLDDEASVQRVITPLEFAGTREAVVVRIRPLPDGRFQVDENGEAALYASMAGGDTDSDALVRWAADLGPFVTYDNETVTATATSEDQIPSCVFRVAEAAQHMFALATSRATRQNSDFKSRVAAVFERAAEEYHIRYDTDVVLPFAGGMEADFVVHAKRPLIVIAANSLPRLLEAEIIHMQSQLSKRPEIVVAVAESQASVGKKHFERANYFTDKTVSFDPDNMLQLLGHHAQTYTQ